MCGFRLHPPRADSTLILDIFSAVLGLVSRFTILIIFALRIYLALVLQFCPPQEVAVPLLSRSHHHKLNIPGDTLGVVPQQPREDLLDQVNTLLWGEPADEAHKGDVVILLQTQLCLEGLLASRLVLGRDLAERLVAKLLIEVRVSSGVPLVEVNTWKTRKPTTRVRKPIKYTNRARA